MKSNKQPFQKWCKDNHHPNQPHPAGRKGANTLSAYHQEIFMLTRKVLNVDKGSKIRDHPANKHPWCTGISSTHLKVIFNLNLA